MVKKKANVCHEPKWKYDKKRDAIFCEKCGEAYSTEELMTIGEELKSYFERLTTLSSLT